MKKWVLLLIIVPLISFNFIYADNNNIVGDQAISAEVTENATLPELNQSTTSSQNGIPGNQTIELINPTFEEVKDFILKDTTSHKPFVINKYECRHFATDVNNNAEAAGIRCAFILLCYRNGQHAVVAFETTDRGMIYIEPQTDAAIQPEVGGQYQNQEIVEILISW